MCTGTIDWVCSYHNKAAPVSALGSVLLSSPQSICSCCFLYSTTREALLYEIICLLSLQMRMSVHRQASFGAGIVLHRVALAGSTTPCRGPEFLACWEAFNGASWISMGMRHRTFCQTGTLVRRHCLRLRAVTRSLGRHIRLEGKKQIGQRRRASVSAADELVEA